VHREWAGNDYDNELMTAQNLQTKRRQFLPINSNPAKAADLFASRRLARML
jgi:hypothetical protein